MPLGAARPLVGGQERIPPSMTAPRFAPTLFGLILVALAASFATAAQAVVLVDLAIDAKARPYDEKTPVTAQQMAFSVPGGPGTLIMTYTEQAYVGGPGGFALEPKDLSPERLGFGGATDYTPRTPVRGQLYRVRSTWLHDFSRKTWVATLTARHAYQAYQVRGRGRQLASNQRLTIEFIPGTPPATPPVAAPTVPPAQAAALTGSWDWGAGGGIVEIRPDGTGQDSRGNTMRWTVRDARSGLYELRWSHGYTDTATLSADGRSVAIVNNAGTRFTATRRGAPSAPPAAPGPANGPTGSWNWGAGGGVVVIRPDGTGQDSRGNTMRWTARNAAAGVYELRWSHGYTDTATLSADGNAVAIVNNAGTRFTATRQLGH